MSDPMPTANEIRDGYAMNEFGEVNDHWAADFDRWIFAHDAEVARKALTDAAKVALSDYAEGVTRGRVWHDWLRTRAEQIGEK